MKIAIVLVCASLIFSACTSQSSVIENPTTKTSTIEIQTITKDPNIESPKQKTPLSTVLNLGHVNKGSIEVLVKGKTPEMDIAYIYPVNYGTMFPIHGMYADFTNTIIITGIDDDINITKTITTKPISARDANAKIDKLDAPDAFNQDLYFHNAGKNIAAADRKGDIRYFQEVEKTGSNHLHSIFYDKTRNEILIKDNRGIHDLLGNELIDFEQFQVCHDSIRKDDNYIVLSTSTWGDEDRIIEITPTGDIVNDKTLGSLFRDITAPEDLEILNTIIYDADNKYTENGKERKKDWAHINSLVYDNSTDILYLSLRRQGVIAVDYAAWKLIWWMVDDTLNTQLKNGIDLTDVPSLVPYRVKGDGQTDGPKNQHALLLKSNGNIAMFDNQGDEKLNPNGSRYAEYAITGEHGNWAATKVREYRDEKLYSQLVSDVDLTGNNHENILMAYGRMKKIIEIAPTNEILFELNLPQNSYRGSKMPLYPYSDSSKKYSIDYNEKEGI